MVALSRLSIVGLGSFRLGSAAPGFALPLVQRMAGVRLRCRSAILWLCLLTGQRCVVAELGAVILVGQEEAEGPVLD